MLYFFPFIHFAFVKREVLLNIVTVGDSKTGKTTLLSALKDGKVSQNSSIPEIFDTFMHTLKVDGEKVKLGLWDTPGEEQYQSLRRLSYPNCDVFVVCFSVNSRKSFENVQTKWLPELKNYAPITPFVLVATKQDLRPRQSLTRNLTPGVTEDPKLQSDDKFVQFHEGLMLANEVGAFAFLECSALGNNAGVMEVFEKAARSVLREVKSPKHDQPRRKSSGFLGLLKK